MHRLLFHLPKHQTFPVIVPVLVTRCSICVIHASKVPSYICCLFTSSRCLRMYVIIVVRYMVYSFVRLMHSLTGGEIWLGLLMQLMYNALL